MEGCHCSKSYFSVIRNVLMDFGDEFNLYSGLNCGEKHECAYKAIVVAGIKKITVAWDILNVFLGGIVAYVIYFSQK